MVKVSFFEAVFRGIPESAIFLFAAYIYTKKRIQVNKFIVSILIQIVLLYLIRFLPINNSVIFILNITVVISIFTLLNNIEIVKAIKVSIIVMICEFLCEGINVFFIMNVLNLKFEEILSEPVSKILYLTPSVILLGIIVGGYYFFERRKVVKDSCGKDC